MLGLLIISLVLAVQSLPIADALASVLEESSTDLAGSAETKTTGEHLTNHYFPDAATYSADKAAYELGQENAGVSWNSPLNEASIIYENIEDAWQDESNEIFADQVSKSSDCVVQNDFQLDLYPDTNRSELFNESVENVNLSMSSDNSENRVSVNCGSSRDMVYREENYKQNLSGFNRYSGLGNFTAEFYVEAEDQYESLDLQDVYEGSDSACPGSPSSDSAESSANSSYFDDTITPSDVSSEVDAPPNTSFDGEKTDNYNVDISGPYDTGSTCEYNCPDDDEEGSCSTADEQEITVEISPTNSEMDMTIETDEELPISGAYRKLAIRVGEYAYTH